MITSIIITLIKTPIAATLSTVGANRSVSSREAEKRKTRERGRAGGVKEKGEKEMLVGEY